MTFKICFGTDIEAILVAKVIPVIVVGIMASTHGIDVHLLHLEYILQHTFSTHHISSIGVKLMSVSALDQDGLTIDKQLVDSSHFIADFDASEANLKRDDINDLRSLSQCRGELIEIWNLSTPRLDGRHLNLHALGKGSSRRRSLGHLLATTVSKHEIDLTGALYSSVDIEYTILIIISKVTDNANIVEAGVQTTGIKVTVAVETGVAEVVLILEIVSVAHAKHLYGD